MSVKIDAHQAAKEAQALAESLEAFGLSIAQILYHAGAEERLRLLTGLIKVIDKEKGTSLGEDIQAAIARSFKASA